MARTYVPTLKAIVLRLNRYILRYDHTLFDNLTPEQQGAYNTLKQSVFTMLSLLLEDGD